MKLIPRELDKLKLSAAGALAQRRLARGVRLNYPEATALIASQVRRTALPGRAVRMPQRGAPDRDAPRAPAQCLEFIRDGRTVADLMDVGRTLLGRRQARIADPGGEALVVLVAAARVLTPCVRAPRR